MSAKDLIIARDLALMGLLRRCLVVAFAAQISSTDWLFLKRTCRGADDGPARRNHWRFAVECEPLRAILSILRIRCIVWRKQLL